MLLLLDPDTRGCANGRVHRLMTDMAASERLSTSQQKYNREPSKATYADHGIVLFDWTVGSTKAKDREPPALRQGEQMCARSLGLITPKEDSEVMHNADLSCHRMRLRGC
jgi:hypothetical protein